MEIKKYKLITNNETTIKAGLIVSFYFSLFFSFSQQLPYYTQIKPNSVFLNPAVIGTKRFIDARLNYRIQWVGFEDAPITNGISLNSRFFKETMGLAVNYVNDKTGPTKRSNLSLGYSYHLRFDDVELSAGIAYEMLTYFVYGNKLNLHIPFDNTIDLTTSQKQKVKNASAGLLFYNDRFHIGISVLNLLEPTINYFPDNLIRKTNIDMVHHFYGSVGYNWSGQPEWIWENSLQVLYVEANPMFLDYNLRLHYMQKVFGGISIRLGDAIALHMGATIKENFQISYSYDLITSPLRSFQAGSHEIMLAWSSNMGLDKKRKGNTNRFKKQKYGFMF
jgi:type IX secretion system PorP/SprF family membrane protein